MITYDSRKVRPGDTFVAIPGFKVDGADFIPQAIEKGAKVIVAEKEVAVPAGIEFKKVPSARKALAELSADFYGHPSRKLKLIGVTGTNGKTTITYLIQSILKTAGHKAEVIGTINSSLTTPESADLQAQLAKMVGDGISHVVMEVSSHALALERVHGCRFHIAIFTNLTHDHLDFHKTMEEYLAAKRKLFEMLSPDGFAVINVDDPYSRKIIETVKGEVIPYGLEQAPHELRSARRSTFDLRVKDLQTKTSEMKLSIDSTEIRTPLIGKHHVYNILAAFEAGLVLGIDRRTIKMGIEAVKVIPGRQEKIENVIIDFAHSPDALQKLIETYRPLTKGKIILVFGCPGERDREKRPIMGKIAANLADYSIITTDDPHGEKPDEIIEEIAAGNPSAEKIVDRKTAIEKAINLAKKGDTVLIAGRGHEKFQDFAGKKVEIDDREIVRSIITSI